jgi:23S rRNA U2552 (ribose-2'-O)-methylase RlmE/FtsJ
MGYAPTRQDGKIALCLAPGAWTRMCPAASADRAVWTDTRPCPPSTLRVNRIQAGIYRAAEPPAVGCFLAQQYALGLSTCRGGEDRGIVDN